VKVLSDSAKPLTLQVGANDGETITLNLSEISVKTLGLDGFNVNGKGVTQNRTATVTDVIAQGGQVQGDGSYKVTTTFNAASADDVLGKLENGNTVAVGGGATYTYDAAKGNFTFTKTVDTTVAADVTALANKLKPTSGTVSGTYEISSGKNASFDVDAAGKITIGGNAAFLNADGELTTNDKSGALTQATLEEVLTSVGTEANSSVTIGGTKYSHSAADELSYTAVASKADVLTALGSSTAASTITLGSGITSASVTFATASTDSDNTWVDTKGSLTKVQTFDTSYKINADTGAVTVVGDNSATAKEYASADGAKVLVGSDGKLTTSTTSAGDKTTDPLKTLDAAFTKLDKLTGELGAVQNRLESTIANLNNVVNNLSNARSRIQDADYATEVSNMSKAQILQQAGTSVLAQANQVPQTVLSLLR